MFHVLESSSVLEPRMQGAWVQKTRFGVSLLRAATLLRMGVMSEEPYGKGLQVFSWPGSSSSTTQWRSCS